MLNGGAGSDYLVGGTGNDTLFGGAGDDRLWGQDGVDYLYGGAGDDILNGGFGQDGILHGGRGSDTADYSYSGDRWSVDLINGTATNLSAGGTETLVSIENYNGSSGRDQVGGTHGANTIWGRDGNDRLFGHDGDDDLFGETGNDVLNGGAGEDWLRGGEGDNELTGGTGADTFVFDASALASAAGDVTTITDFAHQEDVLRFLNAEGANGAMIDSVSDLDTNGDGFITGADDNWSVDDFAIVFDGQTFVQTGDLRFRGATGDLVLQDVLSIDISAGGQDYLTVA